MKWIKYLLYLIDVWEPKTEDERLLILLFSKPNPYKFDHNVNVITKDVFDSITLMEKILQRNPKKEYLFTTDIKLNKMYSTYLSKWYNHNGRYLDNSIFIDWLELAYEVYKMKKKCMKAKPDSIEYRNGVKLKVITDEIDSIIQTIK